MIFVMSITDKTRRNRTRIVIGCNGPVKFLETLFKHCNFLVSIEQVESEPERSVEEIQEAARLLAWVLRS